MFSANCTDQARRFRKPTFICYKSGVGCTAYLTSKLSQESRLISQALTSQCLSAWTIGVVCTSQTERVVVLSKILALNKSLALLLSVLLAASVGTITIGQYRRIGCHDNFVKAKDASRVRDRSWNMKFYLMFLFYLLANNKRRCWVLQVPE